MSRHRRFCIATTMPPDRERFGRAGDRPAEGRVPTARHECRDVDRLAGGALASAESGELTQSGVQVPIIFITGRGSIPMSVARDEGGGGEFLTKPARSRTSSRRSAPRSSAIARCTGRASKPERCASGTSG
jgi:hypothetical protein